MMFETINDFILKITDPVLGYLLYLPRDAAMAVIAVTTSAVLTFVRPFTTNQDLLARCKADKKRLKELIREAKAAGDKEAVQRYKAGMTVVGMKMMQAEWKPLLVAILPILLLATWCFSRMDFYPPRENQPVKVNLYFPASAIGKLVHMIPVKGIRADKWIARVEPTKDPLPGQEGTAGWVITASKGDHVLKFRFAGKVYEMPFSCGKLTYAPPTRFFEEGSGVTAAEVVLPQYRFLGLVPGFTIPGLNLPIQGWLIAYLVIAVPFVFILKWAFRIY